MLKKLVPDSNASAEELDAGLAVVRIADTIATVLVCEKIGEGDLTGALIFYIRFPAVSDAPGYRLIMQRPQNNTIDCYEILSDGSHSSGLSDELEYLTVRHSEGANPPNSAFRRGNNIYYSFLTTSSGPSGPYGATDREVIANINAVYRNNIHLTINVITK